MNGEPRQFTHSVKEDRNGKTVFKLYSSWLHESSYMQIVFPLPLILAPLDYGISEFHCGYHDS